MMIRPLLILAVFLSFLCVSYELAAQSDIALATRKAKLQTLSDHLSRRDENHRREAKESARRMGIPVRRELPHGRVLELQRIAPGIGPIFYVTYNVDAADTVSTDEVWPGGSTGLNLDGSGMTVGEWDGGAIYAAHPDFTGRLTQVDGATIVSNHSTHVAGTLIGSGDWLVPESRGMAYAAHLNAYDWNSDTAEMALAASNELLVSNHSYGIAAGWLYIGDLPPDTWWWIGGDQPSDVEDPNFGYYDSETRLWDQIAFDAPYYLIVKAAGNDRSDIGPAPGEEYTVIDQEGNFLFTSTLSRSPDCSPAGYDCLPTVSVAKNVLTVGAVDDLIGGYSAFSGPSSVQMADFSGWGPTDDGRLKPDVVGNGMFLMSAYADYPHYAAAAGTSMAAPNVSGSLLLLQEHYQNIYGNGNFMRAATLKALVIHTADEAGDNDGPDYEFGWGLVNTKSAAQVITENGGDHQIIEDSLFNGAVDTVEVTVTETDSVIVATLVWADPPGTPVAPSLDPPNLMLVNDLDLRIKNGPSTHLPWVLNPASPASPAVRGDNFRDNVEQVVADGVGPGTYFIEVSHKGTLLNSNPQDYSLIISVATRPPTGSSLVIDENFSGGLPAGWSVETNSGAPWNIRTPVTGNSRLDNLTGGTGKFAMVDSNYSNRTLTKLRTPTFDLTGADAVVLRFKSYFYFDFLESINLDISTDGGTGWSNVWQWQGFNPLPTNYVLDLSGVAAGQSSVTLRFRFDSHGDTQGNLWQVDDVELEAFGGGPPSDPLPGPASNPNPQEGAADVIIDSILSWAAGSDTTSHDVYFGTSSPPASQGNQTGTGFDPGTLNHDTTYYWRIDEVSNGGTTTGSEWSFTTESASQVTEVHIENLTGSSIPGSRNRWSASVQIEVMDDNGIPAPNVFVEGNWSNGANGGGSCTTNASGNCPVQKSNLKLNVSSVNFTVTSLIGADMTYNPAANNGGNSITVSKDEGSNNQLPVARNDSYSTDQDVPYSANVLDNDDEGDAPASVSSFDNTSTYGGTISMSGNGAFTYTPPSGYDGPDNFGYTIEDNNGDSDSANVSFTVNPVASGSLTLAVSASRSRGVSYANLSWSGGDGTGQVTIRRNGGEINGSPTANDGLFSDQLGKKISGSFEYEVCEINSGKCATDTIQF